MTYALRAEAILTRDGQDILDEEDLRLLLLIRDGGLKVASENLVLSESTVRRRVRRIELRMGERVLEGGALNQFGCEIVERMQLYHRLLEAQVEHLWSKPSLTCDGLVIRDRKVLLIKRGREPFLGKYALPGGFVEYGESAEECVVREVREETGLETEVVRLVSAYSEMGRDPRGHFITLLYLLKVKGGALKAGDDAESADFYDVEGLPEMAFDHRQMIIDGLRAAEHPL